MALMILNAAGVTLPDDDSTYRMVIGAAKRGLSGKDVADRMRTIAVPLVLQAPEGTGADGVRAQVRRGGGDPAEGRRGRKAPEREQGHGVQDRSANIRAGRRGLHAETQDLELGDIRSLDVRSASGDLLEFAAGVNCTVAENDNPEAVKRSVAMRTEHLVRNLGGRGITVRAHGADDTLDDVPADIIGVQTDDRSMDVRVARSHRYGCEFRGDVYPRIPEEVSVYCYEPDGASDGERMDE